MKRHRHAVGAIGLFVTLALSLSLRSAALAWPLWLDELATSWVVRDRLADIYARSLLNNLSSLYYAIVWVSTRIAGYSEFGLRLPSLVAGLAVIPAIYVVAYQLTRSVLAAFAGCLVAVDEQFIYYSLEARSYSMVQLAAVLQIFALFWFFRKPGVGRSLLVGVLSALVFYLHFTAVLLLLAEVVLVLVRWIRLRDVPVEEARGAVLSFLLCFTLTLPLLPQLLYQFHNRSTLDTFVKNRSIEDTVVRFNVIRYIFLPVAFGALVTYAFSKPSDERRPRSDELHFFAVAMLVCYLTPPLLAWGLQRAGVMSLAIDRYLIASSVACVLWSISTICVLFPKNVQRVVLLCLLLGSIWWGRNLVDTIQKAGRWRGDWSLAVTRLNQEADPEQAIFVNSGLVEAFMLSNRNDALFVDYLLCPVNSMYRLRSDLLSNAIPIGTLDHIAGLQDRVRADGGFAYAGSQRVLHQLEKTFQAELGGEFSCRFLIHPANEVCAAQCDWLPAGDRETPNGRARVATPQEADKQ